MIFTRYFLCQYSKPALLSYG